MTGVTLAAGAAGHVAGGQQRSTRGRAGQQGASRAARAGADGQALKNNRRCQIAPRTQTHGHAHRQAQALQHRLDPHVVGVLALGPAPHLAQLRFSGRGGSRRSAHMQTRGRRRHATLAPAPYKQHALDASCPASSQAVHSKRLPCESRPWTAHKTTLAMAINRNHAANPCSRAEASACLVKAALEQREDHAR